MKVMSEILYFFRGKGRANTLDMANLREGFSSLKPPWGSMSLASTAGTTLTDASTFYKCEGITQLNNTGYLTSMPQDNRLQYNGGSPRHFHIATSVSFYKTGGGTDIITLSMGLNGTPQTETEVTRSVSNSTNIGSTALHADFMMSNGDYIELFVQNNDAAGTVVTIDKLYMFMVGMIT